MLPLSRPSPPPAPQAGTGPGDLAPNSGRCPDRGWNRRPFGVTSWRSIHRATPARAYVLFLKGVHPGGSPVPARG